MLLLMVGLALADIPPESGYEETCLLEYYDADHCADCEASAQEELPDCPALEAAGKEEVCKSYGATFWSEVWCDPGFSEPVSGPEVEGEDDCGSCDKSSSAAVMFTGAGLLLLVARRRRAPASRPGPAPR